MTINMRVKIMKKWKIKTKYYVNIIIFSFIIFMNKLPINIVDKEQIEQKTELENRLSKINKDLVKIRLQLKNISE